MIVEGLFSDSVFFFLLGWGDVGGGGGLKESGEKKPENSGLLRVKPCGENVQLDSAWPWSWTLSDS